MPVHVRHLSWMPLVLMFATCLSTANAQEATFDPLLLAELENSLPENWKLTYNQSENELTIQSNRITVLDGDISGRPGEHEGSFILSIVTGERIKIVEHSKRQQDYEELAATIRSKRDLGKLAHQPWRPDFFDDTLSYKITRPFKLPVNATDRKLAESLYRILRKYWAAYPASPHADPKHYPASIHPPIWK